MVCILYICTALLLAIAAMQYAIGEGEGNMDVVITTICFVLLIDCLLIAY